MGFVKFCGNGDVRSVLQNKRKKAALKNRHCRMFLGEGDIMSNFSLMTQNIILPEYIQNGTAPFSTLTIAEKYKH